MELSISQERRFHSIANLKEITNLIFKVHVNMVRYIIDGAAFNDYTTMTPNQNNTSSLLFESYSR
ncbi:1867_t:CDS:2 [Ambispora leptoticha]|uniref:1867_t:CDS:1 n=1 Tax=Ambispora leptoticha TaxID=144679 RepID=A0A9N9AJ72_9GLOM|nr:1867_t:CDS:2 [Ambispora leptoticha]